MDAKPKALCFRVENEEGEGMYQTHGTFIIGFDETRHPSPYEDRILRKIWIDIQQDIITQLIDNPYYFGFSTMEQLRHWLFNQDALKRLQKDGHKISIYQTEHYYYGDTQMIFIKSKAKLIGRCDLI